MSYCVFAKSIVCDDNAINYSLLITHYSIGPHQWSPDPINWRCECGRFLKKTTPCPHDTWGRVTMHFYEWFYPYPIHIPFLVQFSVSLKSHKRTYFIQEQPITRLTVARICLGFLPEFSVAPRKMVKHSGPCQPSATAPISDCCVPGYWVFPHNLMIGCGRAPCRTLLVPHEGADDTIGRDDVTLLKFNLTDYTRSVFINRKYLTWTIMIAFRYNIGDGTKVN